MISTIKKFIILVILLHFSQVFAQNLDKYYTQRPQEGGNIFYIFPNDDFKNASDNTAFLFDITYRQGNDSLTINFSYRTNDPDPAKKLTISTSDKKLTSPVEKLYIDFINKKWEHRFSGRFSFSEIEAVIHNPEQQARFTITSEGGQTGFVGKSKKWEKYCNALQKVFYIMSQD